MSKLHQGLVEVYDDKGRSVNIGHLVKAFSIDYPNSRATFDESNIPANCPKYMVYVTDVDELHDALKPVKYEYVVEFRTPSMEGWSVIHVFDNQADATAYAQARSTIHRLGLLGQIAVPDTIPTGLGNHPNDRASSSRRAVEYRARPRLK